MNTSPTLEDIKESIKKPYLAQIWKDQLFIYRERSEYDWIANILPDQQVYVGTLSCTDGVWSLIVSYDPAGEAKIYDLTKDLLKDIISALKGTNVAMRVLMKSKGAQ